MMWTQCIVDILLVEIKNFQQKPSDGQMVITNEYTVCATGYKIKILHTVTF